MNLQELKAELEKRERQLKNADPEQKDFLQKKIDKLKREIKEFKEPEKEPEKKEETADEAMKRGAIDEALKIAEQAKKHKIKATGLTVEQFSDKIFQKTGTSYAKSYLILAHKTLLLHEGKKAKKEKPQPATKKVRAPRTKKQEGKRPSKEDCEKMLAEAKARVAKKKKLREKWAAKGKPVGGTPVDTIKKSADVVKHKVEKIKDSGKTLTKTQAEAITTGIEDIVKAVKKAISDRKDRELFIRRLIKALQKLI